MKKNFMYRFLISVFCLFFGACVFATNSKPVFVSLSPALTEIMYAIDAQDLLVGVSTACNYPKEALKKEKIGNTYFINTEKILKIKPTYILALDSSDFALNKFKKLGITPLCLKYPNIESIYKNILTLGELTGKQENAQKVINYSKQRIAEIKTDKPKKILYLVQTKPMITVGNKSFLSDVMDKSGNISLTRNINAYYPTVSEEFCIKQKPDVIVVSPFGDLKRVKQLFPNTKIVMLTKEQNDIINRPASRIYKSVEFFAKL